MPLVRSLSRGGGTPVRSLSGGYLLVGSLSGGNLPWTGLGQTGHGQDRCTPPSGQYHGTALAAMQEYCFVLSTLILFEH